MFPLKTEIFSCLIFLEKIMTENVLGVGKESVELGGMTDNYCPDGVLFRVKEKNFYYMGQQE